MASFTLIARNSANRMPRRAMFFPAILCFLVFSSSFSLYAQQEDLSDIAPPPAKALSKGEKELLESLTDTKRLTKAAIELMETRMKNAEEADSKDNFSVMFLELGGFHAVMDYTLDFLLESHKSGKKTFSDFKRYEQGLRGMAPRLELIRRDLPIRYEYYVRILIKEIRENRAKAIDPMFGHTVLPEKKS